MFTKRPLIGVTTSVGNSTIPWLFIYLSIVLTGGKAIRLTANNYQNYKKCCGFVIAGGADINPELYGQEIVASINIDPARDQLEKEVITYALETKKPLFGVCRGAQMINIIKGGTLYQDAREFNDSFFPTKSLWSKIFSRRPIQFSSQGILYNILGKKKKVSVNSLHHQAINKLGDGLQIVANDKYGLVQAIENSSQDKHFIIGVQWHPELMIYKKSQRNLFAIFIQQTKIKN